MNLRNFLIAPALLLALSGPAAAAVSPPVGDVMAGEFALQQGDLGAAGRHYLLAAQASPDPALAERATRIALLGDDAALAERALARWRALAPESLPLRAAAINVAMRLGEHESAMDEARALLSLPDAAGFPVLMAALVEARGDQAVIARSVMHEVFAQRLLPHELSSWLRFAGLARRLDDHAFSDIVIDAGLAQFPGDPRARLLEASRLREAGDVSAARDKLLALRAAGDLPPDLRRSAAAELAVLGEPRIAADMLAEGPQDDASLGQRAAWLVTAGDRAGLQALYAELVEPGTPPPSRRLLVGHVAEALGRWMEAERWYADVPRGAGHDLAMLRRSRTLDRLGNVEQALALLHELQADATADGERVRDSYLYESELLERNKRIPESRAALDRGLGVFEDDPVLLYGRAMQHERQKRIDSALRDLRRIIDANPADAQALNAYGYTLAERRKRYAEALPYLQRAHALEPRSAPILDSLGWVTHLLGQPDRALGFLEQAWERQKDAEIAAHLGEVLWHLDRRDEARAIWKAGSAIDARHPALVRTLETYVP